MKEIRDLPLASPTHATTIQDIPPEIIHAIFDDVLDGDFSDKSGIFSCALVCREWRDVSLTHRFRTLSLILGISSLPTPLHPDALFKHWVQDFLGCPLFPLVKHHVRSLTLSWQRWGNDDGSVIQFDFLEIIPLFPALISLELVGRLDEKLPDNWKPPVNSVRMDQLKITGRLPTGYSHSLKGFGHLLSVFGSLRHLELNNVDIVGDIEKCGRPDWSLPQPSSMAIDALRPSFLCNTLETLSLGTAVETLDIMAIYAKDAQRFCLSAQFSARLKHLSVCIRPHDDASLPGGVLNLSALQKLRSIVLAVQLFLVLGPIDTPTAVHYTSLNTAAGSITTLHHSVSLDHIDLRICPLPTDTSYGVDIVEDFKAAHAQTQLGPHIQELEQALVNLVEAQRLGYVHAALYTASPTIRLDQSFHNSSVGLLSTVFPRLRDLGVLRL